ncbi:MAG: hypothetical protein LBB90_04680 [Tannerella sp.]|nr:hypothetical protein [Tannerella sp.]
MESNLNHEQSLSLINEMIQRAKNNFREGSMSPMIFWGYLTAALAIVNYVLLQVLDCPQTSYRIWWLMLPAWIVSFFVQRRRERKALIKTHLDRIIHSVWLGYVISVALFLAVIFATAFMLKDSRLLLLITPVILLMVGMGEFVTAYTCRSRWWRWIAVMFWVSAMLCLIPPDWILSGDNRVANMYQGHQLLIMAVCMIAGFVVPGHVENRKAKKSHVQGA